jgi:ACS family hexuronate transporter-like MFS transporter
MKIPRFRWWILGLLAMSTALSYMDRQNFPVVIGEIKKSIPITDRDYARFQSLFLVAYGMMYVGGGKIVDVLGERFGYALMVTWWSAATGLMGLVSSVSGLSTVRFLLGLGEGGAFPSSAKAISKWFPAKERSFAFGILNTGSAVGSVVAPPLTAFIVLESNWRWVFFVASGFGFAWVLLWVLLYNIPARHKLVTPNERSYLETELADRTGGARVSWIGLFRYRQTWGLMLAKCMGDAAWFFFIFWLPKYLGDVRHLNIKEIGYYAWIPYAAAGVGSFFGGWLSSYLMRRNFSIDTSRKIGLCVGAACMPTVLLITAAPLSMAIVFFSLAMFGHQFWSTIMQTLAADIFPSRVVGSVTGLVGGSSAFAAMVFSWIVGELLTAFGSYVPVFTIAGILHPISVVIIFLVVRKVEMVIPVSNELGKETP